jgi:hypothetical protein
LIDGWHEKNVPKRLAWEKSENPGARAPRAAKAQAQVARMTPPPGITRKAEESF